MTNSAHLISFRKELHAYPEIAGQEKSTADRLKRFIAAYKPDKVIDRIGGHGIAFIFKGKVPGKKIMFRADLDALPIKEISEFDYRSVFSDRAHLCGHDGHMTILAGLAEELNNNRPLKGEISLLFQPSEETGEGAALVLHDDKFTGSIKPDYVFALHNLPGFQASSVIINENIFSSASVGLTVCLHGKSSHAAEPAMGNSPVKALSRLLDAVQTIQEGKESFKDFVLGTIVHISLGEKRFGTSPEYGEISMTLRAYRDEDMETLKTEILDAVKQICEREKIRFEYEWKEEFLSLENAPYPVEIIKRAARVSGFKIIRMDEPFKWSEDFSHFAKKFPGAMFGLGAGTGQAALHNPDYDFPDEIIQSGIDILMNIYRLINE
ncbi:MAG TPA: amidohydrolase [Bacteroidetes bacterium]|nr:amidohydrolase [Bacteroidota bacterium]